MTRALTTTFFLNTTLCFPELDKADGFIYVTAI
jgi:hypothetical protein